jgi:hypothetical protein
MVARPAIQTNHMTPMRRAAGNMLYHKPCAWMLLPEAAAMLVCTITCGDVPATANAGP